MSSTITNVPEEVLQAILLCLPYDTIASQCRMVCRSWNETSKRLLNRGFHRCERYHAQTLVYVKSRLPRRESERRNHPLSRHSDILTAVETRLSLLNMTYNKYLDLSTVCFIPGKVLDELIRILRFVNRCLKPEVVQPQRPHELLQELRDISSMAMEHFDEQIVPRVRTPPMGTGAVAKVLGGPDAADPLEVAFGAAAGLPLSLSLSSPFKSAISNLVASARYLAVHSPESSKAGPSQGQAITNQPPPSVLVSKAVKAGGSQSPAAPPIPEAVTAELRQLKRQARDASAQAAAAMAQTSSLKKQLAKLQRKEAETGRALLEQQRKLEAFTRQFDVLRPLTASPASPPTASTTPTSSTKPGSGIKSRKRPAIPESGEFSPPRLRPRKKN